MYIHGETKEITSIKTNTQMTRNEKEFRVGQRREREAGANEMKSKRNCCGKC